MQTKWRQKCCVFRIINISVFVAVVVMCLEFKGRICNQNVASSVLFVAFFLFTAFTIIFKFIIVLLIIFIIHYAVIQSLCCVAFVCRLSLLTRQCTTETSPIIFLLCKNKQYLTKQKDQSLITPRSKLPGKNRQRVFSLPAQCRLSFIPCTSPWPKV